MQYIVCRTKSSAKKKKFERRVTRARVGAHSNRNVVFLLSQVSHLGENKEKRERKCWKNEGKIGKNTRKFARKSVFSDVVGRVWGIDPQLFVKIYLIARQTADI